MTTKKIEEKAVNVLVNKLLPIEVLEANISVNDKEPFFDGSIYIYDKPSNTKADFLARIFVQVKGTLNKDISKTEITYPVQIVDLNGYLNVGGVIFFVIYINMELDESKIYYNALTPVKIRGILEEINKKSKKTKPSRTKNLPFIKLPKDSNDIVNAFMDFYRNSKKQISFIDKKILCIDDLKSKKVLFEVVQNMNAYGLNNSRSALFTSMFDREIYLYAVFNDVLHPLSDIVQISQITQEVIVSIKVKSKEHYTTAKNMYRKKSSFIQIGQGIELILNDKENSIKINYNSPPMLSDRVKDLSFFIDVIENKSFSINDKIIKLNCTDFDIKDFDIKSSKENLTWCCKIQELFKTLNIIEDLDLSKLTKKEEDDLYILILAIVDKQLIKHSTPNESKSLFFQIQQIGLSIIIKEKIVGTAEYQYINSFDAYTGLSVNGETEPTYPIYSMLNCEHYEKFSNINYSVILSQYKLFSGINKDIYYQANLDVLQMLLAYDNCKKLVLLETAKSIMQWIIENGEKDYESISMYKINYYQSIFRIRSFTEAEENILIELSTNDESDDSIKFASNVLLKQLAYARIYFDKLDSDRVTEIKTYPIYSLYLQL